MKRSTRILVILLVILSGFFIGVILSNTSSDKDTIKDLLSAATFLFGIFAAFSISNSHTRMNTIHELLKLEDARVLMIFNLAKIFSPDVQEKTAELLDEYVIAQIDYELSDFKYSYKPFGNLFQFILQINPDNEQEKQAYSHLLRILTESLEDRKKFEALVRQKLTLIEWIIILLLQGMIVLFMFLLNNGSLLYFSAMLLMTCTLGFFILLVRDLNNLRWGEQNWIWKSLETLFIEIGKLPYFPREVVSSGRARPTRGHQIRLATFPHPYPDLSDKRVEITEV